MLAITLILKSHVDQLWDSQTKHMQTMDCPFMTSTWMFVSHPYGLKQNFQDLCITFSKWPCSYCHILFYPIFGFIFLDFVLFFLLTHIRNNLQITWSTKKLKIMFLVSSEPCYIKSRYSLSSLCSSFLWSNSEISVDF